MRPLAILVAAALGAMASAQVPRPPAYAQIEPWTFHSGFHVNATPRTGPVFSQIVRADGVPSMRVFFTEADVDEGAIRITSLADGNEHLLTAPELVKWEMTSAYFNGDALLIELILPPGARGHYEISHLLVGIAMPQPKTICGSTDDRVPSNDNRSVRMLNGSGTSACSGWLSSTDDCVFSAGHCFPTYANVGEVNVPLSNSNGSLNHPPTKDQFPVDGASLLYNSGGQGNDWALARLFPNSLGQSAASLHGFFALGFFAPTAGETMRVTGYGADTGTADQTNQTNTGPYVSTNGTSLRYAVDTMGGNSGSVVIHESSGMAVAIHTHGGCSSGGGSNSGTSVNLAALKNAWTNNCTIGPPVAPTASFTSNVTTGVETQAILFEDTSTGVPTSWAWDFDGDGTTDSVLPNPSFTYAQVGTYDVRLTASNSQGSDTLVLDDYITILPVNPVSPPYAQGFTNGLPADGSWQFQSGNGFGSIAVGSNGSTSPGSGGDGLLMASSSDGNYVTNESILHFRLDPTGSASLSYWFKEFADEDDPEDGLFLSNGVSEVLLQSHQAGPAAWTNFTVDLGVAVANAGFSSTGPLRLIFRQRDNFAIATDGHAIDDVTISGQATLCPAPTTYGTGELGSSGAVAAIGTTGGEATAGNTSFAVVGTGFKANQFAVLFGGNGVGSNPQGWGTILVAGPLLTRTYTTTNGTGVASVLIPITAPLVGTTRNFQFAARDPGVGGDVQASNAVQVTFCP